MNRACVTCHEVKPATHFWRDSRGRVNHPSCIGCYARDNQQAGGAGGPRFDEQRRDQFAALVDELTRAGKSGSEIADELHVTRRTITRYRAKVERTRPALPIFDEEVSMFSDTLLLLGARGACRSYHLETFFPHEQRIDDQKFAKTICAQECPVVAECLRWALDNPEQSEFGIWGATTPAERAEIRRRNTRRQVAA